MIDDADGVSPAQAVRLNDAATDERVRAVLGGLRERIGQELAEAVTDLQALGVDEDDIDSLVEKELILVSKYKRVPDEPVEAEFRE